MTRLAAIRRKIGPISRARVFSTLLVLATLAVSKLAALFASIAIARYFGKDVAGILFFVTGIITLSMSVTTLGITASASFHYARNLARGRFGRNWQTFNLAMLLAAGVSVLAATLSLAMQEARGSLAIYIFPVVMISCFMAAARQLARMLFLIEHRRPWSLFHDSISFNVALVVSIVAFSHGGALAGIICILVASALSGGLAIAHLIRLHGGKGRGPFSRHLPPRRYARLLMGISLPSMVAQGSAMMLNKIDVVMLAPLSSAAEVSDYAVAMRMTYLAGMIAEVVAIFILPKVIAASASRDPGLQWKVFRMSLMLQGVSVLVISVPLMIYAQQVATILFGSTYVSAVPVYLVLQAGKLMTIIFAPSIMLFTGLGYNREMAKVATGAAVVNLVLNFLLIPQWGAMGAAYATLFALCLMASNYASLGVRIYRSLHSEGP